MPSLLSFRPAEDKIRMRLLLTLLLLLSLAGCSKSNNQGSSSQPANQSVPLKKDPGIEAALAALQAIDTVESYVEKPADDVDSAGISSGASATVGKVLPLEPELYEQLQSLLLRVSDLEIAKAMRKASLAGDIANFHIVRDQLLADIKKKAAAKNASAEMAPGPALWIMTPSRSEKWERWNLTVSGRPMVEFKIVAKNRVMETDRETTPTLAIACGDDLLISVDIAPVQNKTVRWKTDTAAPVTETWIASNLSIISNRPVPLLKRLLKAKTFSVEFTPYGKSRQTATFKMANLKEMVEQERRCDH